MLKVLRNPRFWLVLVLLILVGLIHYPRQLLGWNVPSFFSFLGLTRHAAERILLLVPIIYGGIAFGTRGGIATLVAASLIMLPRTIFLSEYPVDAWFETIGIIAIGIAANLWLRLYRRNTTQLKNIEEMLSQIIDGSPIPCFSINTQHKVTHWNRALEAMSGIKREEVLGTNQQWRAFYAEKRPVMADLIVDGASADEVTRRYDGKSKRAALIEGAYEAENFLPAVGTGGRWLHFTASPIRDSHGVTVGAIETLQDITERKKAEADLLASEKRFRDLFENALDPIWVHDLEGNIQIANQAIANCTGYTLEELLKMNVKIFLTEESLNRARAVRRRLMQQQPLESPYEQRIIRKDGNEAICMITTNLIISNGLPVGFQNIARDVTEEKRMTENMRYYLRQITRAQEDERKRIAQELHDSTAQNLIALLHRLENLLDRVKLPLKEAQTLWSLHDQIRNILQEVRRFSRDLRPAVLDDLGLLPALEWVTGEIKNQYGIDTSLQVVNSGRRLSPEAELLLFRIVQEALRNVGKHARATVAVVSVTFGEKDVTITITDNGTGFQIPDDLGELTRRGKLGLLGMQERVQLLGGSLKIVAEADKGTTITVNAPV